MQTVFGEGPHSADILFVGEQPGDQEDLAGQPFGGNADVLATVHPSYLLHVPSEDRDAAYVQFIADLSRIRKYADKSA